MQQRNIRKRLERTTCFEVRSPEFWNHKNALNPYPCLGTISLAAINIIIWIIQTILNFAVFSIGQTWAKLVPPILGFLGSIVALICAALARRHFPTIYGSSTTVIHTAPAVVTQPAVVQTTTTTTNVYQPQPVQPGYVEPTYSNPQPGYAVQPGYGAQPSYAQPQYAQPYMAQPGYAQPPPTAGYPQPGVGYTQPYPN
eukprot:TRINITY_DN2585_c0_g1_i2.p1 TRINITY_DN2585_c0_g1~~TRINITY_DN2585_c0_g1_i2.p1  ORF type:complete len:198 (+),score=10.89 TRINITY_DN2585_c0_g1_i2:152-745(+)